AARPAPAGGDPVLRLPHHGGVGPDHVRNSGVEPFPAAHADADGRLVSEALRMGGTHRFCRRDRGLDHHRGRPATVDGLWRDALGGYMVVYLIMFPSGAYLMWRIVKMGPGRGDEHGPVESGVPKHPVIGVPEGQQ